MQGRDRPRSGSSAVAGGEARARRRGSTGRSSAGGSPRAPGAAPAGGAGLAGGAPRRRPARPRGPRPTTTAAPASAADCRYHGPRRPRTDACPCCAANRSTRTYALGRARAHRPQRYHVRRSSPAASWPSSGPSGSGKSTLLGLLAGLDRPTRRPRRARRPRPRLARPRTSAPACAPRRSASSSSPSTSSRPSPRARTSRCRWSCAGEDGPGARGRAARAGRASPTAATTTRPSSRGASSSASPLARAFVHRPRVLFADEPTGNLDAANGAHVIELLSRAEPRAGHHARPRHPRPEPGARARGRVIRLRDGAVVADTARPARREPPASFRARVRGARSSSAGLARGARLARGACCSWWRRGGRGRARSSPSTPSPTTCATSVREQARALLGADLALWPAGPRSRRARRRSLARGASARRRRPGRGGARRELRRDGATCRARRATRLVQVHGRRAAAIPSTGRSRRRPPATWARLAARAAGCSSTPRSSLSARRAGRRRARASARRASRSAATS